MDFYSFLCRFHQVTEKLATDFLIHLFELLLVRDRALTT
ncbi:Uncharacterised protein [Klebsiella pneumoniae]|nr:Uncharacterised protein [Klebsiella pneumoniae]